MTSQPVRGDGSGSLLGIVSTPSKIELLIVRRPSRRNAEEAVRTLISWAGDDPNRAELADTPTGVLDSLRERFSGYEVGSDNLIEWEFEEAADNKTIFVRNLPLVSHCEHHMMPFIGQVHVAYQPAERVATGRNLVEVVDLFARRLQSQERLTGQILAAIDEAIDPHGTAVLIHSEHLCMTARGVRAHGTTTVTMKFSGVFSVTNERERILERLIADGAST